MPHTLSSAVSVSKAPWGKKSPCSCLRSGHDRLGSSIEPLPRQLQSCHFWYPQKSLLPEKDTAVPYPATSRHIRIVPGSEISYIPRNREILDCHQSQCVCGFGDNSIAFTDAHTDTWKRPTRPRSHTNARLANTPRTVQLLPAALSGLATRLCQAMCAERAERGTRTVIKRIMCFANYAPHTVSCTSTCTSTTSRRSSMRALRRLGFRQCRAAVYTEQLHF